MPKLLILAILLTHCRRWRVLQGKQTTEQHWHAWEIPCCFGEFGPWHVILPLGDWWTFTRLYSFKCLSPFRIHWKYNKVKELVSRQLVISTQSKQFTSSYLLCILPSASSKSSIFPTRWSLLLNGKSMEFTTDYKFHNSAIAFQKKKQKTKNNEPNPNNSRIWASLISSFERLLKNK